MLSYMRDPGMEADLSPYLYLTDRELLDLEFAADQAGIDHGIRWEMERRFEVESEHEPQPTAT